MHGSISDFICSPLNVLINSTGAALYVKSICVYIINLIHSLGIKKNTAGNRNSAALCTAAATPGGNRYFIVVGDLQYL